MTACLALVGGMVAAAPAAHAAPGPLGRPALPAPTSAEVHDAARGAVQARQQAARSAAAQHEQATRAVAEQHATWPGGGTATLATGRPATEVGGLPVRLTAAAGGTAAPVDVTVLDQKAARAAGVDGVLLSVAATTGGPGQGVAPTTAGGRLSVGYASFASGYGGDWSGRLGLVRLPACALTTPQKAACRTATTLPTANDVADRTLSADLPASTTPAVLAVSAGQGEATTGSGDYTATELSSASTWAQGGASGSFTWSYPMAAPPAPAGPAPTLGLAYDSGSVDGRTASTNNQTSQVGEGFGTGSDSYVTRQYGSCDQDGHDGVYDPCWKFDNASLVLNGTSTELVKDDKTGTWRLADDDASTVIHSTGADNGDQGDGVDGAGEYWTVITGDGTRYVFGLDKLPGAGTQRTNSVWTVPVFGDDSGEPGYAGGSAFADRWYDQAWRWNLDYVVDTHGNAETYWYTAETNSYKKNGATTANAGYTRGGYLDHIYYGQRSDTLFTATAPYQVHFGYSERCTAADCSNLTKTTAPNWPDVPFDAICAAGASDTTCRAQAPSFFTRKRLTQVLTSVWSGNGTTYTPVDTWDLQQAFLDPGDIGDSSDQALVLDSITHTGNSAGNTALDPVSFTYRMLPNRVDATDDVLPLNRPRIDTVQSETGALTTVTMSPQDDCVRGSKMPAAEDDDTMACYPVYWHINGATDASLDWFHKYRVVTVLESDPAGGNVAVQTSYDYSDPAWHHDGSPFTPDDERTWSSWRGYGTVTRTTGTDPSNQLRTVTRYLQGMNGDKQKSGTPRSVSVAGLTVPGLTLPAVTDSDEFTGFQREEVTYDGATAVSATADDPWSAPTATQHTATGDFKAFYVRTRTAYDFTYLTVPHTWRTASTTTTYDSYGMAVSEDDTGDTARTGDETCARTWYARNPAVGLTSLVSRTRKVARPCGTADSALSLPAASTTRGDLLSDTATVYDDATATGWTTAQTPTAGNASWTGRAIGYPAAAADGNGDRAPTGWQTTATSTFDSLGRTLSTTDAAGNTDSTAFTPAGAGPQTRTVDSNALAQKTTTFYDGLRGLRTAVYDANNQKTEMTYDGLGRLTAVWLPDRVKSVGDTANTTYTYRVKRGAAPFVATSALGPNGGRTTSYQLYDSLMRPLQVQAPTPAGGRTLTDTRYDSRGLAYDTFEGVFDSSTTPNGTYARAEDNSAPTEHRYAFDGAGRQTSDALWVLGVRKGNPTLTGYTGDSTTVSPPAGGSASRTVTDARGRTVQLREYAGTSPADSDFGGTAPLPAHTTTAYTYTGDDQPATVTGPDGAIWAYTYDLFGRQTSVADPDRGTTTTAYTPLDQIDGTTDAAGRKLLYSYDALSRTTGEWQTARTDANKLSAWTYDTVAKGKATAAISYDGGLTGRAYTQKVTAYDSLYHVTGTETDLDPTDPLVSSGAVKSSYSFSSSYNPDGTLQHSTEPAAGGLPQESVSYGYLPTAQVDTVTGASGYLQHVAYSPLAQPQQLTLATAPSGVKKAFVTDTYEQGTGRLTGSTVTDETHAYAPQALAYSYDDAGDVTRISDSSTLGGTGKADTQCFGYDGYRRLTSAWTPADATCTTAAGSATGGAAPYSTGYSYDAAGLRTALTTRTAAGDSISSYCYNDSAHKHAVTVVTTGSCTGTPDAYGHDAIGDTTTRPGAGGDQNLTWNAEGSLAGTTEGGATTVYVYDGNGDLLIRRASAGGESVLYLGATEIHSATSGGTTSTWGVRSYTMGPQGQVIATRSTAGGTPALAWLAGDDHGTSSLAMDASTQSVTKRYIDPFGGARGTPPASWPDDKSFLGAPQDDGTGLVQIGDREYDPAVGGFLSVDPVLQTDQPQTLGGYTYGSDNPATFSDPSGDGLKCGTPGEASCPHTPSKGRGDQGDHRTQAEKDRDRNSPAKGNSGGRPIDPKTRTWLKKNLGYNGGALLDDAALTAWLESVDNQRAPAIIAFDKCLRTGSSAAQCLPFAKDPHGKSGWPLHDEATQTAVASGTITLGCVFVDEDAWSPVALACGAVLPFSSAAATLSSGYLAAETCSKDIVSWNCSKAVLATGVGGITYAKKGHPKAAIHDVKVAAKGVFGLGKSAARGIGGIFH